MYFFRPILSLWSCRKCQNQEQGCSVPWFCLLILHQEPRLEKCRNQEQSCSVPWFRICHLCRSHQPDHPSQAGLLCPEATWQCTPESGHCCSWGECGARMGLKQFLAQCLPTQHSSALSDALHSSVGSRVQFSVEWMVEQCCGWRYIFLHIHLLAEHCGASQWGVDPVLWSRYRPTKSPHLLIIIITITNIPTNMSIVMIIERSSFSFVSCLFAGCLLAAGLVALFTAAAACLVFPHQWTDWQVGVGGRAHCTTQKSANGGTWLLTSDAHQLVINALRQATRAPDNTRPPDFTRFTRYTRNKCNRRQC